MILRTSGRMAVAAGLIAAAGLCTPAWAQLTPDQLFNGINRPLPMKVAQPAGVAGDLTIELLAAGTAEVIASAPVKAGGVDLAAIFPMIWQPEGAPKLMYAQLAAGGKRVGPAVVLQPMTTPKYARFDPRTEQRWAWYEAPTTANSGVRAWVDKSVIFETTAGDIQFVLRPDEAPNTCINFLTLAAGGYYSNTTFHRIADIKGAGSPSIIQGGDPSGSGEGGPGYQIDLEDSHLVHDFGVLSMARTPEWNSGGSQFFICLDREAVAPLDGNYTAFAQAVSGADVIMKIASTPLDPESRKPVDPPTLTAVRVVDAPPYGLAPTPVTKPQSDASKEEVVR